MSDFQKFVRNNEKWFSGRLNETNTTLNFVEFELNITLPMDIRWLLEKYGYSDGTGISNIQESISITKLARKNVLLPNQYIVLYDHQDSGVILLDTKTNKITGKNRVIDTAWHAIPDKLEDETIYPNLTEYVKKVIEVEIEFNSE